MTLEPKVFAHSFQYGTYGSFKKALRPSVHSGFSSIALSSTSIDRYRSANRGHTVR